MANVGFLNPLTKAAKRVAKGVTSPITSMLPGGGIPGGAPGGGFGFGGGFGTRAAARGRQAAAKSKTPLETDAIMAAIELWTVAPNGNWSQRTDAVRLYPSALFQQYRNESIAAIQNMRPAVLKIWTLNPATGAWHVEVHNAT